MKLLTCENGQEPSIELVGLVRLISWTVRELEFGYYYPKTLGLTTNESHSHRVVTRQVNRLVRYGVMMARREGAEIAFWKMMENTNA